MTLNGEKNQLNFYYKKCPTSYHTKRWELLSVWRRCESLWHPLTSCRFIYWICFHKLTTSVNSLWPSDNVWQQRSESTLAQVMACCLAAPSHHQTSVDQSSLKSSDIHLKAMPQAIPQSSTTKISLKITYRKVSNIRRSICQNLNDSRLVLQLSVPNPLKPSVKSIMKM